MGPQIRMMPRTARGYEDRVAEMEPLRLEMIETGATAVREKEARYKARLGAIEDMYKERDVIGRRGTQGRCMHTKWLEMQLRTSLKVVKVALGMTRQI